MGVCEYSQRGTRDVPVGVPGDSLGRGEVKRKNPFARSASSSVSEMTKLYFSFPGARLAGMAVAGAMAVTCTTPVSAPICPRPSEIAWLWQLQKVFEGGCREEVPEKELHSA